MKQLLLLLSAIVTALTGVVGGGRAQARAEVAGVAVVVARVRTVARRGLRPAGERVAHALRLVLLSLAPAEPIWAGRRRI